MSSCKVRRVHGGADGDVGWVQWVGGESLFFLDTPNFVVVVVVVVKRKGQARVAVVECDCFLPLSGGRNSVFGTWAEGFECFLQDVLLSRHLASFLSLPLSKLKIEGLPY